MSKAITALGILGAAMAINVTIENEAQAQRRFRYFFVYRSHIETTRNYGWTSDYSRIEREWLFIQNSLQRKYGSRATSWIVSKKWQNRILHNIHIVILGSWKKYGETDYNRVAKLAAYYKSRGWDVSAIGKEYF